MDIRRERLLEALPGEPAMQSCMLKCIQSIAPFLNLFVLHLIIFIWAVHHNGTYILS